MLLSNNCWHLWIKIVILFQICCVFTCAQKQNVANPNEDIEATYNAKSLEMLKYMNPSVNPCNDFYEFACGNWPMYHRATADHKVTDVLDNIEETFDEETRRLLAVDHETDTNLEKMTKNLYKSCLNVPLEWNKYLLQMKELIQEFGEMPLLTEKDSEWSASNFSWSKTVANMQYKYGSEIILSSSPLLDDSGVPRSIIIIGRPSFYLGSRKFYLEADYENYRISYAIIIAYNLMDYLGIDYDLALQTAKDIVEFEVKLAQGLPDDRVNIKLDKVNTFTTLKEMQLNYGYHFNPSVFLKTAWGSVPNATYYEEVEYLQNLIHVMETSSPKNVANYIFYKFIEKFFIKSAGHDVARQKQCLTKVREYLPFVLDKLAYHHSYDKQTEQDIKEMWHIIKEAFQFLFHSEDKVEIVRYIKEVLNITNLEIIGLETPQDFLAEYEKLVLEPNDFLGNMKTLLMSASKLKRAEFFKIPGTSQISSTITVPVTMLQPYHLWSPTVPMAYNYAKLGSLISREVMRDLINRNYLGTTTKCFANQYNPFTNLEPSLYEIYGNVADYGGVNLAYHAYLKWYQDKLRTREQLSMETYPRLRYNSKQLFFINYAQMWCEDVDDMDAGFAHRIPAKFRIIPSLANLADFAKEFRCPVGSNMNPIEKCTLYS